MRTKAILLAAALTSALLAPAQAAVWQLTGDGNWNVPGNWSGGVPNAQDAVADFSQQNISGNPSVVTLDTNATVGELIFGRTASGWNRLHITPSATEALALDNSSGTTPISVSDGTGELRYGVTINAVMTGDDAVTVAVFGEANFWEGLTLTAQNTYSGGTTVTDGRLVLGASSTDVGGAPVSGPVGTGTLILQNGADITAVNGNQSISNPVQISGAVTSGRSNSDVTFTGLTTLTGHTTVTHNGGTSGWLRIEFSDVAESVAGTDFTVDADSTSEGNGDRNIHLLGDNSYTGTTTIKPGRVILSGDNSAATGDFVVEAGGIAELQTSGAISDLSEVYLEEDGGSYGILDMEADVTVAQLYLDGVAQGAGTYNSTTDPNYFIGNGDLIVPIPEPATMAMLGLGGLMLAGGAVRRRRRR
jgi:autotransporter-associated beta strand protein